MTIKVPKRWKNNIRFVFYFLSSFSTSENDVIQFTKLLGTNNEVGIQFFEFLLIVDCRKLCRIIMEMIGRLRNMPAAANQRSTDKFVTKISLQNILEC